MNSHARCQVCGKSSWSTYDLGAQSSGKFSVESDGILHISFAST